MKACTTAGPMSAAALLMTVAVAWAEPPIDIGTRLELMVDTHLIERCEGGAELRLHRPCPREVAIVHDEPWEGNTCGFHAVFRDGENYRMYYRGSNDDRSSGGSGRTHPELVCYAESADGIHWEKPELGIVEFNGSKKNNIVWDSHGSHSFAAFKDANPDCPPEARYKALAYSKRSSQGLYALKSADAIHWSRMSDKPVITRTGDSQSVAFWDTTRDRYVAFHKLNRPDEKAVKGSWLDVATATSPDFLNWSDSARLAYPGAANAHLYTNAVALYYRAPHIFIGLPTRTQREGDWHNEKIPHDDISDAVLMTSRDGRSFKRWDQAFIRPGREAIDWQRWGGHVNNMPAWGIVETRSTLPGAPRELSIYSIEGYFFPVKGARLRRFTLRPDGFVSVNAPLSGGELITKPIRFEGEELVINFSTSGAGTVRVEVQNADGKPVEGFALADCPAIRGDTLERTVSWKGGADVSRLAGRPVRLRIELRDADLFALRFR